MVRNYYCTWRERFNDYEDWFNQSELLDHVKRIRALDGDGEAEIYRVVQGKDVTVKFTEPSK